MKINIAGGTGVMGRVHKPLFETAGHEVIFSGRHTTPSLEEAANMSDVTIVSVPIPATHAMIKRVAPYANALMDFTGLKQNPIADMLCYSHNNCEVMGLHPMYKDGSFEGKTVIYCPTKRSGEICSTVVDAFLQAGVKMKEMSAYEHDRSVCILQNARIMLLQDFALLLEDLDMPLFEAYELAPPPTKTLIDLIARQVDPDNDHLYQDMISYNPESSLVRSRMVALLYTSVDAFDKAALPKSIRSLYGSNGFLEECQERAKRRIA